MSFPRSRRRKEADHAASCIALVLAFAATNLYAQPIPALRPARGEISPTLWEQHGWLIVIISVIVVITILLLVILLTRPKRMLIEPPEVVARRGLMALQNRPQDGALIMQVSRIFRRYVIFAFGLSPEELTTAELSNSLPASANAEPALTADITDFLRQCDEDKFSPRTSPPRPEAASRALQLLEKIETHRHQAAIKQPVA